MIVIPVYEGVDLLDVAGPFEMFHWAGLAPKLVAQNTGDVTSAAGLVFRVADGFSEAPEAAVLWTPGGTAEAMTRIIKDPARIYLDFLINQSRRAPYVVSVCTGSILLAAAGLLDGYTATTHWHYIPCLRKFPRISVAEGNPRFHRDRNRMTGGGISSGLDEALELIRLLRGDDEARRVQQITQYYPDPPVTSAIPKSEDCPLEALFH